VIVDLTEEEVAAVLGAIHGWQDVLVECADDLAQQEHPDDHEVGRRAEKSADILDVVRRKLGDTWEPDPSYTAPDYPPEE
jgi:hypothetical protein